MKSRTKITQLMGVSIRDIRMDEKGFLIKVHSKVHRRSFWIGADFDGLWDENGNEFEANVPFLPTSERADAGVTSSLSPDNRTPDQVRSDLYTKHGREAA